MPRGRGGARQGTPGTAYGNRTDLNMPISTVPNQEYGKATQQQEAQRAVPMAASPAPTSQAAPTAPAGQPLPKPGSVDVFGKTQRPQEPVTAGVPFGPGPGPEIMSAQPIKMSQTLSSLSQGQAPSAMIDNIASMARLMGI